MNGKLYIKKFIRDDGETLSFDAEEIYLSENNTLLVRSDPATTAVEFTEEDGGEMIRQRGATYSQPVSGLIVPKSTEYWALCVRLSRFFILNHTYKIVYIKRDGSMFSMNRAWINAGLQIVPVPYENYSTWTIEFKIGDNFWTEYAEDGQGKEIYSNTVELPLLTAGTGGEVWSDATQQTLSGLGNYFAIDGTSISASINKLELRGDTYQQSYSGKNLLDCNTYSGKASPADALTGEGYIKVTQNTTGSGGGNSFAYYDIDRADLANQQVTLFAKAVSGGGSTGSRIRITEISGSPEIARIFPTTSGTSDTFNMPANGKIRIYFYINAANVTGVVGAYTEYSEIQLELGAQATSFEPYVGGIPSPSPDYPQPVNVVTGGQTINVRGVNMFNVNKPLENKYLDNSGRWATSTYSYVNQEYIVTGSSELSFSFAGKHGTPTIRVGEFKADGTFIKRTLVSTASTLTLDALTNKIIFSVDNLSPNYFDELQIELGPSPTSYQPYTSQSYTVDLGSIELCKIGDYQDYIYKSGDDWYVHKATGKAIFNGTEEGWSNDTSGSYLRVFHSLENVLSAAGRVADGYSNYFIPSATNAYGICLRNQNHVYFYPQSSITTLADFKTWLSTHNTNLYYPLATTTDTKITDTTLVGQLEALAEAQAYNGKTVYQTNSATMPAILSVELLQSVGGGEVWDNVGAVWEEGVGGVQTINVETTQTTYPVWTVTGPCSNPTLQNDTTDTLASFDGMIASGQTLTVNFADNTAYLDSAPVAKYVSGYVSLAPGENVIGFNSDGGSTQTSTISWDNIIN